MTKTVYQLIQIANEDKIYCFSYTSVAELVNRINHDYNTDNSNRRYGNGRFIINRIKSHSTYPESYSSPDENAESQNAFKEVLTRFLKEEQDACDIQGVNILYNRKD